MNYKRLLLATLVIWLFALLWTMVTCGWLFNWVYTIPPIIWKAPEEMMTTANTLGSVLTGIINVFIFVLVYALLAKCLPIKKPVKRGLTFGLAVYLVGPFSGFIGMPFYMTISTVVVGYWILNMLASYLIMGALVGAIYKQ